MSDERMTVLIAGYSSPAAAGRDFSELMRLHDVGVIADTKGLVLLSTDADAKISVQEAGGGLMGKVAARSVAKSFKGRLAPDSGTVVAIFNSTARAGVEQAVSHHVRRVFATADGSDGDALDAAFTKAGDELTGPPPRESTVTRVEDLSRYSLPGRRIEVNGVNMHVADEGSGDQVVLLLHGMPDTSACWKLQVPDLVAAGYRVIVPDLIGCGSSDKPEALDHYVAGQVVSDLADLLNRLGIDRVHLVGLGWGARFCWQFAMTHPFRVGAMTVISAGHPKTHVADDLFSFSRSRWDWFPVGNADADAARLYAAADCSYARMVFGTHPELQEILARNLSQPEGFGPTLRWDAANPVPARWFRDLTDTTPLPEVHTPVLAIWPTGDLFCSEHEVEASGRYVSGPFRYEWVKSLSHWAPLDAPGEITRLILEWIVEYRATVAPS